MPSSPNYKRDLKQEYATQVARGETKKRAKRNAARRKMVKAGLASKGDGKDVGHKNGVGAGNGRSNLTMQTKKANRSHGGKIGDRAGKAAGARKANASKKKKAPSKKKTYSFTDTKAKPRKYRF